MPPALLEVAPLTSSTAAVAAGASTECGSMQDALTSVLGWIEQALKTVQVAKWTQIGFERSPDGNPDTTRPLFAMRNPNVEIDRLLQTYKGEVMPNLHIIIEKVEPILDSQHHES
jgi:hypothetical protein